mgnify:CR=1 FL=1
MQRDIVITADGSTTIHLPDWDEQYHSKHGAIQEAYHVFIKHGLHHYCQPEQSEESQQHVNILEIGFGTGLNAFITLIEAEKLNKTINYNGVEAYPISKEEILDIRNVTGFFEQIGYNTQYIIHPEEIVASNFELLFEENPEVQSKEILDKIEGHLIK